MDTYSGWPNVGVAERDRSGEVDRVGLPGCVIGPCASVIGIGSL
jgi:hypothetical protein